VSVQEFHPLPRSFYEPSARKVAPKLLGHWLIRQTPEGPCGGPIVETEAYLRDDPACHAFVGPTNRNRAMFGEPGHAYVYLIYGFYYCFNTVCLPHGAAEAVLVRAVQAQFGLEYMRKTRPVDHDAKLTSGPGKLCVAMNIDRALDGVDICSTDSPVFVAENPEIRKLRRIHGPVVTASRIGINVAADWPLRFYLAGSHFLSRKHRVERTAIDVLES
jgi:DNA-3-methyladenine glycosylase